MSEKSDWQVVETVEDIAHVKIGEINYFIDKEEACIVHALLCLTDEVKNVRDELMMMQEKMYIRR